MTPNSSLYLSIELMVFKNQNLNKFMINEKIEMNIPVKSTCIHYYNEAKSIIFINPNHYHGTFLLYY